MTRVEDKINNFIDMVFLDSATLSACGNRIENRTFMAIIQFKKKMLTCQIGIIATVEDAFFRYFNCIDLSAKCVYSMAMGHCLHAYDVFSNIFFALLYSCSFLVTLIDFCVRNGVPEFKELAPTLCKNIFGFMTNNLYSFDEWEKLLEFSTAFNLPEMVALVKSCIMGNDSLFTFRKNDHNYEKFGVCDISALERLRQISMPAYLASFMIAFSNNSDISMDYMASVIDSFLEFEKGIQTKLLQITEGHSRITLSKLTE